MHTWQACMVPCARTPAGGRGPRRLPCQGCEGKDGGGITGLTGAPWAGAGLAGCSELPARPPAPEPMNQGLVVFQPAGNATDVSTPPACGVCTKGDN